MLITSLVASVLLGGLVLPVHADTYNLAKEYIGPTFFQDWNFYGAADNLTNGDAFFLGATQAVTDKLAYVDSTTNHAIIKVDNTSTVVYNDKRNTIRMQTNQLYSVGSVWVVDMLHVPYGCSVWPAVWSKSPNWPSGGEIDTFEGVNLIHNNQMSLHTLPGCKQVSPVQTTNATFIPNADCSNTTNNNEGCIVNDPDPASYGANFADAGGGVWVTEYAQSGISIWFMTRSSVPSALTSNSSTIDTSTFGTPTANWPTGGCDMDTYFSPQNLIIDITLCGDFGNATFSQTCPGDCYLDWVLGNGSNYATAYFEIASLRVFSKAGTNTVIDPGQNSTGGNNTSTSNTSTPTNTPNSALQAVFASRGLVVYIITLFAVGLASWVSGL